MRMLRPRYALRLERLVGGNSAPRSIYLRQTRRTDHLVPAVGADPQELVYPLYEAILSAVVITITSAESRLHPFPNLGAGMTDDLRVSAGGAGGFQRLAVTEHGPRRPRNSLKLARK